MIWQTQAYSSVPRGELPSLADLFLPDTPKLAIALGGLGDLVWLLVYLAVIRQAARDRSYGIPLVAIALNFTWELVFGVLHPELSLRARIPHLLWFVLDLVIVWQLFRYGRERQTIPEIRRWFYPVVVVTFVLALLGHVLFQSLTFNNSIFRDTGGHGSAYLINFVMSILFIFLLFNRRDLNGLSYTAGWLKMIGTGLISVGNVMVFIRGTPLKYNVQIQQVGTTEWKFAGTVGASTVRPGFYYYLFITIFLFDALYLVLLHRARRNLPAPATGPRRRDSPG